MNAYLSSRGHSLLLFLFLSLSVSWASAQNADLPSPIPDVPEGQYRLSSGDQVSISVFGEPDLAISQRIDAGGKIVMPLLGEVILTGKTVREAEQIVETRFRDEEFLVKPQVTVQIVGYRSRQFYVFGEVRSPGMKAFPPDKSRISVVEAISLAGDFTPYARTTDVQVTRRTEDGSETKFTINVRDIIQGNEPDNRKAIEIHPGDVVLVRESRW